MNVRAVMEELQMAKEALALAQQSRDQALKNLKEVSEAQEEKDRTALKPRHDETEAPSYNDKSYWETRYAAQGKEHTAGYEWYLEFEKIQPFLHQEIEATRKLPTQQLRLLIPGCGDSMLGEDLLAKESGLSEIVGVDFSSGLIEQVKRRAKSLNLQHKLKYRVGDVLNLSQYADASFDLVVDKGTLDAIATANADSDGAPQMDNIVRYIHEMWRIMTLHARMVIVTNMPVPIFSELVGAHLYTFTVETGLTMKLPVSNWQQGHSYQALGGKREDATVYCYSLVKIRDRDDRRSLMQKSIVQMVSAAKEELIDQKLMGNNLELEELTEGGRALPGNMQDTIPREHVLSFQDLLHSSSTRIGDQSVIAADMHSFPHVFLQVQHDESSLTFAPGSQIEVRYWLLGGHWQENDTIRLVLDDTSSHRNSSTSINDRRYYGLHDLCYDAFEYTEPPVDVSSEAHALNSAVASWLHQLQSAGTVARSVELLQGSVRLTLPEYGGVFHCSYVREVPSLATNSSSEPISSAAVSQTASSTSSSPSQPPPLARPMSSLVVLATSCSSRNSDNCLPLCVSCPISCGPTHQKQVPRRDDANVMGSRMIPHHKRRKGGPLQPTTLPYRVFVEHLQQVQRLQILVTLPSSTAMTTGNSSSSSHGSINRIMTWLYEDADSSSSSSSSSLARSVRLLVEFDYLLPHVDGEGATSDAKIGTEYLFVDLDNHSKTYKHDINRTEDNPLTKQTWSLHDIDWAQIQALQQPNRPASTNRTALSIAELLRNDHGENILLLRLPLLSPSTSTLVNSSPTRDEDSLLDSVVGEYRLLRRFLSKPIVSPMPPRSTYQCHLTCAFCSHPLALLEQKVHLTDIVDSSASQGKKATKESKIAVHALPVGLFNEFLHEFVCCNNENRSKDMNADDDGESVDPCIYTMQCEDLQVQRQTLYCGLVSCWLHPQHLLCPSSSSSSNASSARKSVSSCRFVCKDAASLHDLFTATGAVLMTSPLSLPPPKSATTDTSNDRHSAEGQAPRTITPREVSSAKKTGVVDERCRLLQRAFQSIIHTDYCAVRCRRCDARLGDARVNFDALDNNHEEEHGDQKEVEEDVFPVAAIQHVQFSWHAVRLSLALSASTSADFEEKVSVSLLQQAARLALYILEKTAKPLVCFYLATSSFPSSGASSASSKSDDVDVIVLKVLSKHSNAGAVFSDSMLDGSAKTRSKPVLGLSAALKVAVLMGHASDILRGHEARIPLEIAEFIELQRALREAAGRWRVYRDVLQVPLPANQDLCFLPL